MRTLSEREQEIVRDFYNLYTGQDPANAKALVATQQTYWMGRQVCKCPTDAWVYQEIIYETRPDLIIECGTGSGGSALYFACLMDLCGTGGNVITIDKDAYPALHVPYRRITHMTGDSLNLDLDTARRIKKLACDLRVMVSLDSCHTYSHVKQELALYAPLVSPGCYCVVEDTGLVAGGTTGEWCDRAVTEFLTAHPEFEADRSRERHLMTGNAGGWLRRRT